MPSPALPFKVLIADDHTAFGAMLAAIVRAGGASVSVVQTAQAALAAIRAAAPDMLITDLRFSTDLGGLALIRAIRADAAPAIQQLPILVLSAHADVSTVKQARAMGVNDFLGKPISATLLLQRVAAIAAARAWRSAGEDDALVVHI